MVNQKENVLHPRGRQSCTPADCHSKECSDSAARPNCTKKKNLKTSLTKCCQLAQLENKQKTPIQLTPTNQNKPWK